MKVFAIIIIIVQLSIREATSAICVSSKERLANRSTYSLRCFGAPKLDYFYANSLTHMDQRKQTVVKWKEYGNKSSNVETGDRKPHAEGKTDQKKWMLLTLRSRN